MIDLDISKVEALIRHVAATEVMPRFRNLAVAEVREKKPGDFVTVADEASEKALSLGLRGLLPGSVVVGEESVSKDASVLHLLSSDRPVWIIDPIDGTYNFAHGRSKFGILVALVKDGVTLYGWAFDAPGDRMAVAVKGAGATINGRRAQMRKSAAEPLEMSGMGGGGQAWHFEPVKGKVREIVNVRSSLHDFINLAAGEADFVVHINRVTPWDHAPTVLLAQEAGAYVALAEDQEAFHPAMLKHCLLLAAADEQRWRALADIFYPKLLERTG